MCRRLLKDRPDGITLFPLRGMLPMTWEIKRVVREPVYRLFLDGQPIRDYEGRPVDYDTEEHAQHVAANWDSHRAPTWAELRGMSDDEVERRAHGEHFPITQSPEKTRWWRRLF